MNRIPQHTARLAERLLRRYCERICPPAARHAVQLDFLQEHDRVTLFEVRAFCGVPGARRNLPVAQFRYRAASCDWRMAYADEAGRWRPYKLPTNARNLVDLLREVDADTQGLLWGRVDGRSLRWCSSRGRCGECDARYCEILGLWRQPPAIESAAVPAS
jgi:hypothetical protein